MPITYRPVDKYAFLFTGPTLGRFMKDLENVFHVLTEYYNYPPGQIMVVFGSAPPPAPTFPGATTVTIGGVADLQTSFNNFAAMASGPVPGGWKTALVYLTGGGLLDPPRLVIDGAATTVDPAWLTARLNGISACHVNVVAQQAGAGGFLSALTGSTLTQWSFTHACSASQDAIGNNALGGYFTDAWVKGLKLQQLPPGTADAGQYADQLGAATDLLVSLEEAEEFAHQILDAGSYTPFSTPGYSHSVGPQHLGLAAFLIRDGSAPDPFYESPDIVLDHPNHPWVPPGDLWIPDLPAATPPYNNTIQITVRNKGTHPVRDYSLGIELFKSGLGAVNEVRTECNRVPSGSTVGGVLVPGILVPIDLAVIGAPADQSDTFNWNTPFYQGLTHECIKAKAELLCADVTPPISWSPWSEQNQAQRNTDEMTVVPAPPPPPPFPDLQGFRKHRFGLRNPFETARRFLIPMPGILQEFEDVLELDWFATPAGEAEEIPIDPIGQPVPHLAFTLKAGEERDLVLRAKVKAEFAVDEIRLPFDIFVQGDWPQEDVRDTALATELPGFALIAGFTVVVRKGSATLGGTVVDRENEPAADATVFLRTVDDFQGATLRTGDDGKFDFAGINPDVYRLWAEAGGWRSEDNMVVLLTDRPETVDLGLTQEAPTAGKHVEVVLDRIRILNDLDPCLKGKGEVKFSAEVVPDNDPSRRQVTRLPASGVYKVSQKPGKNDLELGVTLFDGIVKNRALAITISGVEVDTFDPDDEMNRYHRAFTGDPRTWEGQYYPFDEYLDREDVKQWALWYRIIVS